MHNELVIIGIGVIAAPLLAPIFAFCDWLLHKFADWRWERIERRAAKRRREEQ